MELKIFVNTGRPTRGDLFNLKEEKFRDNNVDDTKMPPF
jgi:hypothetical protein